MKTQQQLCSPEQSKKLQEVGFDWLDNVKYYGVRSNGVPTKGIYTSNELRAMMFAKNMQVLAPTIALALMWFREVKGVQCGVNMEQDELSPFYYRGTWYFEETADITKRFDAFEPAESALLDELLKIKFPAQ